MKKLIFCGILILFFLAACSSDSEEADNTQAVDPPDENLTYITVYLDGYEPPAQSRAINKVFAQRSCDYFEVVFLYNGAAVSGQWKIGQNSDGDWQTAARNRD